MSCGYRDAAQSHDLTPAQKRVEALDDHRPHQLEFLGPNGRRACHREHAGAFRGWRGIGGYRLPHGLPPTSLYGGQHRVGRELISHAVKRQAERPRTPAPRRHAGASASTTPSATARRTTSPSCAPDTCSRSVVVMSACPPSLNSSTNASRRTWSSSLMTSSSSITGGASLCLAIASRSARRMASRASLCWPCEP